MLLLADLAGTFAVADLYWVTAATFPAAVSILEPLDNLVGSERLEIITRVYVGSDLYCHNVGSRAATWKLTRAEQAWCEATFLSQLKVQV